MTQEHLRENAAGELRKGLKALAVAEKLAGEGFPEDAASRAYYAAFHFARVLAWAAGEKPKTHKGVAHLLNLHWIAPGRLPKDTAQLYDSLHDDRQDADYGESTAIDESQARRIVANARVLVERMGNLLRELGVSPQP